ncbi:transposase [Cupriavidus basilensis]|uniref:Transposase n=1 Tax=Cupriavidus basilensis TaxID=68895 RepID=A0ABT6AQ60_9BURK|nr:transposase [Cupriavidus basilensis]MDF3834771.1 transposase [Cupriavidus basilensis]
MGQIDLDFLPLQVINVGANDKRSFDRGDKGRLVKACLRPGMSMANLAIKAGVNANQLRCWIEQYKAKERGTADTKGATQEARAVFVPMMEFPGGDDRVEPGQDAMPVTTLAALPVRLSARWPSDAGMGLEC